MRKSVKKLDVGDNFRWEYPACRWQNFRHDGYNLYNITNNPKVSDCTAMLISPIEMAVLRVTSVSLKRGKIIWKNIYFLIFEQFK